MKEFACGSVVPGCDAKFTGDTEDEILSQVPAHAAEAHGMSEVPPEVVEQVKANITDSDSD